MLGRQKVAPPQTHNIGRVSVAVSIMAKKLEQQITMFQLNHIWYASDVKNGPWTQTLMLAESTHTLAIDREWELEKMTDNTTHLPRDLEGQGLAKIPQHLSGPINVGGGLESAI